MHLQQTKGEGRAGGPQYYFHKLTEGVKIYLRAKGAVRVALVTPYGATKTNYYAVSEDRKLDKNLLPIKGKVGHDRIQQGGAAESIGEAIRLWYKLPAGDFKTIEVDVEIIDDAFYLRPTSYKYTGSTKVKQVPKVDHPLTFTHDYVSKFWTQQLDFVNHQRPGIVHWSLTEICRVLQDHIPKPLAYVKEEDLLRASGPLKHLGVALGGYVGKGYDCLSEFTFLNLRKYPLPVEVKKRSQDFKYQEQKYGKELLSRALILCAVHDHKNVPKNVDVIELKAMCEYLAHFPAA
jgi:hypothetical protein